MLKRIPRNRAGWIVWVKEAEEKSPAKFRAYVLTLAAVLILAHYTVDEMAYQPEHSLWTTQAFWCGAWIYAAAPFVNWFVWKLASGDRLKTLKPILAMGLVLCAGSALAFCAPNILRSVEAMHVHRFDPSIEKWHWFTFRYYWRCWTPLVLVIGNLMLLWRWATIVRNSSHEDLKLLLIPSPSPIGGEGFRRTSERAKRSVVHGSVGTKGSSLILRVLAAATATAAFVVTALHLVLPKVSANENVVGIVRNFLVQAHLRNDFDYLIQQSFASGQPLAPLLTHLELANLQRRQFHPNLDDLTFREYVLSPEIAALPLKEPNWRRTLWENFYPRIRHETDTMKAAQIVVRFLREQVGIDPSYDYQVGVETIWSERMIDEAGFERIYVAALRSVGIAARMNEIGKAELLNANQWQSAPRALVSTFEVEKFPVPMGGLVNFRNWTVED